MFAGILEWPQIWPCARWGMDSKVTINYFKVYGITVYVFKQVEDLSAERRQMESGCCCGATHLTTAQRWCWGLQGGLLLQGAKGMRADELWDI